ncbi:MAG: hypothetical protein ACYCP1_07540 [Thermoplasmataceae archaeon]
MIQIFTEVVLSTLFILIFSLGLSILMTVHYLRKKAKSLFFWSAGMWGFAVSAALELAFAADLYNEMLIKSYLFAVAALVALLAMGSVELTNNNRVKIAYGFYNISTVVILLLSLAETSIGNILSGGVVYGSLPVLVIVGSSLVTFPATVILFAMSLISYRKTRQARFLNITAGIIVVSIAGTLYIANFPSILYIAEFIGIFLIWLGFVDLRTIFHHAEAGSEHVHGGV